MRNYILVSLVLIIGVWLVLASEARDQKVGVEYDKCVEYFQKGYNYAVPFPEYIQECLEKME